MRGHLIFALKYEGIELAVLKVLFEQIELKAIADIVRSQPTGAYSRRIWFLYEWLCEGVLDIEDGTQGNFAELMAMVVFIAICFIMFLRKGGAKGLVFPVSAAILDRIDDYRQVLEHFSKARLELIKQRPTEKNNVEVLNETIDLYRYFDATQQAEFFFKCVEETVNKTLPEEVSYLIKYDRLNNFFKNYIDMPDKLVDLTVRFLNQNDGKLSKRARDKEFQQLTAAEVEAIKRKYDDIFNDEE